MVYCTATPKNHMTKSSNYAQAESRFLSELTVPDSFQHPQAAESKQGVDDLRQAIVDAMAAPIQYPPISEAIFPGDLVAIAIQSNLPQAGSVLEAIIDPLQDFDIVIVAGANSVQQLESVAIADMPIANAKLVVHDCSDESSLAMIGINSKEEPVYLNRDLVEADVVIPIGCPSEDGAGGALDCIYPFFSGTADQVSFEQATEKQRPGRVRLANNLLGSFWSIQLVIGPGDEIHSVLVGETERVIAAAKEASDLVWKVDLENEAELAIATIESRASKPTWQDFCAALRAADRATKPGCPIVVCSEIDSMPDKKIRQALMMAFETQPNSKSKLSAELLQISEIVRERTIFSRSELTQAKTEELGLGFIADDTEFQRIIDNNPNGVLLRDAHRCKISL